MVRCICAAVLLSLLAGATLALVPAKSDGEKDTKKIANKEGTEVKRFTAPEGWLKSLPRGYARKGIKPRNSKALDSGFGWYNNCAVNNVTDLLGSSGTTAISVYADDVDWMYAFGGPHVTSPIGDGGIAGDGWRFPNAQRFGIVVFQGNNYWNVESTDPNNPTRITGLSNTTDILVTVNDTNGNYGDNGGSFDLYLRKDN
jgi:hypothetical protein